MTQAFNLSQLANNLNSSGQLDATDGLVNAVPVANGGTGATTDVAARTNLNVPTRTGDDATGTWNINILGNAGNGGVTSVNGATGAVSVPAGNFQQLFRGSGTFVVPAGVTAVYATVIGGGGGGQGGGADGFGGNAGGSSISQTVLVTGLTPGSSIPVTVGNGGAGGAGNNAGGIVGSTGGTSQFGSYVSVTGGAGGGSTAEASTMTTSYIKQSTPMAGNLGFNGPGVVDGRQGGGGGGAGWSSGGGGGAASYSPAGQFGAGGAAFNGSAGLAGVSSTGSVVSTAGGEGGSNPGGASGGTPGAYGGNPGGGGGGGGGAGAVLLRW